MTDEERYGEEGYGEEGYTVVGHEHYTDMPEHHYAAHIFSFLIGGLVGAGMALLFAPQSGRRTRQRLKNVSRGTKEKMSSYYDVAMDTMGVTLEKGKEVIKQGKPLFATALEAGINAYEREKERMTK